MSARTDLGKIIWETSRADEQTISATGANIVADAILAAGYRKQDTITTVEELRELPVGAVLFSANGSVGEVRGLDDIDDEGHYIVSRAVFWAGSDCYEYLDGFTMEDDRNLPAKVLLTRA